MEITAGTDLLLVGRVIGTHGLQGEIKVLPDTDDAARATALKHIWLGAEDSSAVRYKVHSARLHRTKRGISVLMQLDTIEDMESAAGLRALNVYATTSDLPPLASDEYFLHDLIGARVHTNEGTLVGELKDIWDAPASDVYVVQRTGQPDALIPAVPAIVASVDADGKQIIIRSIEGLLD